MFLTSAHNTFRRETADLSSHLTIGSSSIFLLIHHRNMDFVYRPCTAELCSSVCLPMFKTLQWLESLILINFSSWNDLGIVWFWEINLVVAFRIFKILLLKKALYLQIVPTSVYEKQSSLCHFCSLVSLSLSLTSNFLCRQMYANCYGLRYCNNSPKVDIFLRSSTVKNSVHLFLRKEAINYELLLLRQHCSSEALSQLRIPERDL